MNNRQGTRHPARHTLRPGPNSFSLSQSPGQVYPEAPYVTHGDLLRIARRNHYVGIHTQPIPSLCSPTKNYWVFKATVYKSSKCRGFVGYGDAHPGNVSPLIFNHAEMRMAEARAVNRAHRKAYGVALCLLEELPPWPFFARADSRLAPYPRVPPAVSERTCVCVPHQSGRLSAPRRRFSGLGPKKSRGNANLQCIPVV